MHIITASKEIFRQLIDLCSKLDEKQYVQPLDLLKNNSIGKHVRHIIEFYDLLRENKGKSVLSYDLRAHCQKTEANLNIAINRLIVINEWFECVDQNLQFKLVLNYGNSEKDRFEIDTNMQRELAYNIEHAIHHMAIIRIAVEKKFKTIKLDDHFGIAYSTLRFRDGLCAR